MKKRNKKYNPLKFARQNNEYILKDFAVAYYATDEQPKRDIDLVNLRGVKVKVTQTMADAIEKHAYLWSIFIAVFFVEKGVRKMRSELIEMKARYYQRDLVDYLNERHQAFIDEQKAKNVKMIGAGWIASPVARDFAEDEAGNIFEMIGAL